MYTIDNSKSSGLSPHEYRGRARATSRAASPSLASELTLARRRGHTASGMRLAQALPQIPTEAIDINKHQDTSTEHDHNATLRAGPRESPSIAAANTTETNRQKRYGSCTLAYIVPPAPSSATSQISSIISAKLKATIDWRQRLRHFTWSFFSVTMATGGIASILYNVPFRFKGLHEIGLVFFIFNLFLFSLFTILITTRFIKFPETLLASVTHPSESLFMPCFVASCGTVLLNLSQYGLAHTGYWLNQVIVVLFWINCGLAIISSAGIYVLIWSTQTFTIAQMTPIWIAPAYALLSVGPIAGSLGSKLESMAAVEILIGGFTCQGIGFLVALTIYSAFIYRLMTEKLPQEPLRPGMFISIGPAAFTATALINIAAAADEIIPDSFMGDGDLVGLILVVTANFSALWLWGLGIWFFIVSCAAHLSCIRRGGLEFALTWWSFIFPNTALTTSTFAVGKAFGSPAIQWVACIMTILLVLGWFCVFSMMIRAIILKHILWPQKQDDRDEGGFIAPRPQEMINERKDSV